jgi:hypothetical protein
VLLSKDFQSRPAGTLCIVPVHRGDGDLEFRPFRAGFSARTQFRQAPTPARWLSNRALVVGNDVDDYSELGLSHTALGYVLQPRSGLNSIVKLVVITNRTILYH